MNYCKIDKNSIANGDGVRVAVFVSGCTRRCPGCFNPETWDFNAGQPFTTDTAEEIMDTLKQDHIQGLTILGGEPLEPENMPDVLTLVTLTRMLYKDTKDIWLYTGKTLDPRDKKDKSMMLNQLISELDVIIDGPFIEAQKDISLKYRGSRNQRVFRRYWGRGAWYQDEHPEDDVWQTHSPD